MTVRGNWTCKYIDYRLTLELVRNYKENLNSYMQYSTSFDI